MVETSRAAYWPGDSDFDHLEFALEYDGTNLALLAELFTVLDAVGSLRTFASTRYFPAAHASSVDSDATPMQQPFSRHHGSLSARP